MAETNQCRWCGRPDKGDAGDFYHEKTCHRKDVLRRMEEEGETEALKSELWQASYTGD
jgi:hypothetical protein